MTSFIESGYSTRAEYEAAGGGATLDCPTFGYWKIRGLAAPGRMMFFYKGQKFTNKAYGEDAPAKWHGGEKVELITKNSMMNLPYIIDGETIVTQSNSCLLYLGKKLGLDKEEFFFHNHQVIDQAMDLRNDTMTIVYPFAGKVPKKDAFPAGLKSHLEGSATTNFKKLEGFCKGPYMCGAVPQSGDFHVFEMVDQHMIMASESKVPFDFAPFPKLLALHAAMKAEPKLAKYFASDMYTTYAMNNPSYTHFSGSGFSNFGPTVSEVITP